MTFVHDVLRDRRNLAAFALGCVAVTIGVLLHLPMFLMARDMGYRMAGMAMDNGMLAGMGLIVGGIALAGYGLLPAAPTGPALDAVALAPSDDAPLRLAHWGMMAALSAALVIDVMKPASLGFVVPGMMAEYAAPKSVVAWVPFGALAGTVLGSLIWGALADLYGRKAAILLSAIMFVGTSICGAMPSLAWNIGMCFLMGAAAGGMLPVAYALLAETMPTRHRGWSLVLVGGLGAAGGYFAASGFSALLQPIFGWRILWFLNLPSGLLLLGLGVFIPESARFLLARGRTREAQAVLLRFGAVVRPAAALPPPALSARSEPQLAGRTLALSIAALAWGLINFGLLLWLPGALVARGYSIALSSRLLAQSALIAVPTVFVAAGMYSRWSTKGALAVMLGLALLGLVGVLRLDLAATGSPVGPVALLIIGANGLLAILLPYAAESYPGAIRGRATGWVAACTKLGGLLAQLLGILGAVPALGIAAACAMVPTLVALVLVVRYGAETRGRQLDTGPNGGEVALAGESLSR